MTDTLKGYLWRLATVYAGAYLAWAFVLGDGDWIFDVFDWDGFTRFTFLLIVAYIAFLTAAVSRSTRDIVTRMFG